MAQPLRGHRRAAPRSPSVRGADALTGGPVASRSAVLVCQGRAVADGRYGVGRFSDPIARDLLDPEERAAVDRVRDGQRPSGGAARIGFDMLRGTAALLVPRTIAIDRVLVDQAADGVLDQVVLLGAGLDSRGYRMSELADTDVFEVDHVSSQADKRRRIGALEPTARRLVAVTVDLARDPLAPALAAAGFDAARRTTWVWEGVVPYLPRDAVAATTRQVSELSGPGSRLVVNYQERSVRVALLRRFFRLLLRISRLPDPFVQEPWRSFWTPRQWERLLGGCGFDVVSDDDLDTLASGLDLPGEVRASLRNGRVLVAIRR